MHTYIHSHPYLTLASGGTIDVNAANATGVYIGSTGGWTNKGPASNNAGALITLNTHSGNYYSQLWFDTGGNEFYFRSVNNALPTGVWNKILHSGNFVSGTDYAPAHSHPYVETAKLLTTDNANPIAINDVTINTIGYTNSLSLLGQSDGAIYAGAFSSSWIHEIYGDFRTGQIAIRGKNSGTWQAWRTVWDSGNITPLTADSNLAAAKLTGDIAAARLPYASENARGAVKVKVVGTVMTIYTS